MATNTTNYNLTKSEPTDFYDIGVTNENLDKIDTAIKAVETQANTTNSEFVQHLDDDEQWFNNDYAPFKAAVGTLSSLTTTNKTNIAAAINEVNAKTQIATTAEAQAGTDNTKVMTPLRVADVTNPIKNQRLYKNLPVSNVLTARETMSFDTFAPDNSILPEAGDWLVDIEVLERNKDLRKIIARPLGRSEIYIGQTNASGFQGWQLIPTRTEFNELFQSVSNGKAQVAAAITGKGVTTAADATFAQLASNINAIPTGSTLPSVRFASGSSTSTTGVTGTLNYVSGTNAGSYQSISGTTGFTPSRIVVIQRSNLEEEWHYSSTRDGTGSVIRYRFNASVYDGVTSNLRLSGNFYVNDTGFVLPVSTGGNVYDWYAYG